MIHLEITQALLWNTYSVVLSRGTIGDQMATKRRYQNRKWHWGRHRGPLTMKKGLLNVKSTQQQASLTDEREGHS